METLVEMKDIRKEFPGVVALDQVSFDVKAGEVHLLLGENGAGKSTLMKILSGIYTPTSGTIVMGDQEYSALTPKKSKELGISIIYQELSVVNELSIAENMFVGKLPTKKLFSLLPIVDRAAYIKKAEEAARRVGLKKPVSTLVQDLSISEKQMVEIAKALVENSKLLVMDEPTSSLTEEESKNLQNIIRELKAEGIGIVYISHKMKELREIGDRVTILKDGKTVATKEMSEIHSEQEIISMMVGRELQSTFFGTEDVVYKPENIMFKAEHIVRKDRKTQDVSFELYRGEVLGVAGLVGAGRTELMNAIFAGESFESGKVWLDGKEIKIGTPYTSIKNGIAMITENRRETGIFPNFGIKENLVLVNRLLKSGWGGFRGMIHEKQDQQVAEKERAEMQVKCSSLSQLITELSGGNQQKVIVGKWLAANAKVLIFDEPTKGIDIGTKTEMYKIMRGLAEKGVGVIMISSEMPELLGICDRIMVMNAGRKKGILTKEEVTEELILQTATM